MSTTHALSSTQAPLRTPAVLPPTHRPKPQARPQRSDRSRRQSERQAPKSFALELTPAQSRHLMSTLDDALMRFTGPLAAPCRRIVHSPGRRLRPALTMACAALGTPTGSADATALAAAVELLHCATLVHDDVIDGADARRGVGTINGLEGTPTAIVAGDVLIAAAMRLSGGVQPRAAEVLAETLAALCSGQTAEEALRYDVTASPDQALRAAEAKTGSLLRAACVLGAIAGGLDRELTEALGTYGSAFGVCLQMVDDVLDLVSTAELLGKPVCADVTSGVMSIPVVYCLSGRSDLAGELAGLLESGLDSRDHEQAVSLVRRSDAIAETIGAARLNAESAASALRTAAAPVDVEALGGCAGIFIEDQLRTKVHRRYRQLVPPLPAAPVPAP